MFDSIFTNATTSSPLEIGSTLLGILVGILLGLIVSIVYSFVTPKRDRSSSLTLSLIVLPAIIAIVIMMIGGNLARAFSMAGVFALVRFRSVPGDSKDITFVFMTMASGISIGLGYLTFAALIVVILSITVVIVSKLGLGISKHKEKNLRITIPEDMNYYGAFDDLFEKYTSKFSLQKVKSTNLGTLFELSYHIILKDEALEKNFIDELRCRNGNLNIQINIKESNELLL